MSTELQLNKLSQLFLLSDGGSGEGGDSGQSEPLIPILQSTLRNNKQQEVMDQLSQLILIRETEIEKLCHQHHQEFIHSVDQLWVVKQGTNTLKDKIIELNDQIQESGTQLLATKTELVQHRRIQQNLETAIETLQTCLHILKLANRVNTLLHNRNYSSALKTLDELQNDHLPQILQYEFAVYMAECIPSMRDLVKKAVILEKRDWLEKLKTVSRKEGHSQMQAMIARQAKWKVRATQMSQSNTKKKSGSEPNVPLSPALHCIFDEETEDSNPPEQFIDYQPFYQCLHIHNKLGQISEFQKSYEEDRRLMANIIVETSVVLNKKRIKEFEFLLQDIVGFFQVEHTVLATTNHFRYPSDVDHLWSMMTSKIVDDISRGLGEANAEGTLPKIKTWLEAFIQVTESFGYDIRKLNQFLEALSSF